jgi:pyrimidine operon attenuation protein/uracil phosphoribosyltransferase
MRATGSAGPFRRIHDDEAVAAGIERLAGRLLELAAGEASVGIAGVHTRGLTLAARLHERMKRDLPTLAPLGRLDITLYRDDLSTLGAQPIVHRTELPFALDGTTVLLIDDVIFTGRTVRAALDALLAFGRPAAIRLGVLVDRGHREYPVQPDAAAFAIATHRDDIIAVRLAENDGDDAIDLFVAEEDAP